MEWCFFSGKKDFFQGKKSLSDLGWPITPEGVHKAVSLIHSYVPNTEIWITENGISTQNEENRIKFLYSHLEECKKNTFIKRYYYWTLIDCFEWDYSNTYFGLVKRDRKKKNLSQSLKN